MSSKYKALLRSKETMNDLDVQKAYDEKLKSAHYFVKRLEGKDKWLLKRNVRRLSFHIDLDFVRTALIDLYKSTEYEDIKQTIKEIHDGTHDLSDLLEEMADKKEYNDAISDIERELLVKEFAEDLKDSNFVQEHIGLLKLKTTLKN